MEKYRYVSLSIITQVPIPEAFSKIIFVLVEEWHLRGNHVSNRHSLSGLLYP